jgi:hypothetical protein
VQAEWDFAASGDLVGTVSHSNWGYIYTHRSGHAWQLDGNLQWVRIPLFDIPVPAEEVSMLLPEQLITRSGAIYRHVGQQGWVFLKQFSAQPVAVDSSTLSEVKQLYDQPRQ